MNIVDARNAVYCRLLDNYTGVEASAITLDNEDFKEPLDAPWLRLTVRTSLRRQSTLGAITTRRFRTSATAYIQVFVPANSGTNAGDILAEEAAALFSGISFLGLDFNASTIRETGVDGKWYQYLVDARFNYDERI